MTAKTIMIQGTTSDAGKSTLVAGLCRLLYRRKMAVVPFKPQNMALNSAVTAQGGEIGRAQAVQAQACGLQPHTDMNPVLIKPSSDKDAQIVIHGKSITDMSAQDYHQYKTRAMDAVLASHRRLAAQYDVIVVEGAGSPAEINLRDRDIANMGFAEAVDCPVIIVADIDKGGVFAHLTGTLNLLSASEQHRTRGFIINRFRGDIALLQSGLDWLEQTTAKKVYGTMPYLMNFHLEAEDAINADNHAASAEQSVLKVVVPVLPRISNHTDFDALRLHPKVMLQYIAAEDELPPCDLVILPGSKNTRHDMEYLRQHNWQQKLNKHLRYGGKLLGVCGGYQMLGRFIHDPDGNEAAAGSTAGFGLLDVETTLQKDKTLKRCEGVLFNSTKITGYEIHLGETTGAATRQPVIKLADKNDGAMSDDGQIMGTYLHGLFDHHEACDALLHWAGLEQAQSQDYLALREREIDRLADSMEQHLDIEAIIGLLGWPAEK